MIDPDELRTRTFPVVERGYDRAAVTQFLDDFADELEQFLAELDDPADRGDDDFDSSPTIDLRDPFAAFAPPRGPADAKADEPRAGSEAADRHDVSDTDDVGERIGELIRRAEADADEFRARGLRELAEVRQRIQQLEAIENVARRNLEAIVRGIEAALAAAHEVPAPPSI